MAQEINLGRVKGPNEVSGQTTTPLDGILMGNGANVGAMAVLPVEMGGTGANNAVEARDLLRIPPPTYGYYGKDLRQVFSAAELHEKIAAGDFEGICVGDYWPITLSGSYYDYADSASKTLSSAVVIMEVAGIDVYYQYGDTSVPHHLVMCSRDCLPNTMKMRSANETWYNTAVSDPWLGCAARETLNNATDGIITLVGATAVGAHIYTGPNGDGMRILGETKAAGATAATSWAWQNRGKLFLPYEREVWGQDIWSEHTYGGGGNALQWPIFAGSRRHIIKGLGNGGSRYGWWCASSNAGSAASFCYVASNGHASYTGAATALGVPLCFLLI